jgi:sugar lactone lactonase YvrE
MHPSTLTKVAALMTGVFVLQAGQASAQAASTEEKPFAAGTPLGVTVEGVATPISSNVKVFGSIVSAESCVYDESRGLILAINRGAAQNQTPNDGYVSLVNHDGSVHTAKWIGATRDGLVLNQPFGSAISSGTLYVADRDGGTSDTDPSVSVLRMFDVETGAPKGEIPAPDSPGFNDIAVAADGTIYATQTNLGIQGAPPDPATWKVFKVTPVGEVSVLIEGDPLNLPNGIELDGDGNIVVVNIGTPDVLTFSPEGELLNTEQAAQAGNDGLVIMEDGTKYVSSVREGGVSHIAPGQPAELIATGIPSAASMCYDSGANQLVIPMNANNALSFVPLD